MQVVDNKKRNMTITVLLIGGIDTNSICIFFLNIRKLNINLGLFLIHALLITFTQITKGYWAFVLYMIAISIGIYFQSN